ncbi:Uncharacterised protein g10219 [Pycnogonum litorale]
MSNLRRHFPFGGGHKVHSPPSAPVANPSTSVPSTYQMGKSQFHFSLDSSSFSCEDTDSFGNNIHDCLDACTAYTQALNTLCGSGTHFAQCLVNLFHNLHPYQEIAGQFLEVWEELSKGTGSASAAVKTETLINLQDVLTRLENSEDNLQEGNGSVIKSPETIQVLSTCLNSFLRLQALFSYSSWESFAKLSRNYFEPQNPSAPNSVSTVVPAECNVGNTSTNFASLLSRLETYQSSTVIPKTNQTHSYNPTSSVCSNSTATYPAVVQQLNASANNGSPSRRWNNVAAAVSSNDQSRSETPLSCMSSPKKTFQGAEVSKKKFVSVEELQDVLGFLSCRPDSSSDIAQSCPSLLDNAGQNINCRLNECHGSVALDNYNANDHPLLSSIGTESQRHDVGKRTWPRMNGNVNPANWGWMFTNSNNDAMFPYNGANSNYGGSIQMVGQNVMQTQLPDSGALLSGNKLYHEKYFGDSAVANPHHVTSPSHHKHPSELSMTSDGQTKSWSSTQGDSSSSSEENGSNDTENVFSIGLNIVVSDLVASVRQRRHSSTDEMPERESLTDLNLSSQYNNNNNNNTLDMDDVRMAKTSTWPLKQQSPRLINQSSSMFFGSNPSNCRDVSAVPITTADGIPVWNVAPPVTDIGIYPPTLSNEGIEKYSLFGKSN